MDGIDPAIFAEWQSQSRLLEKLQVVFVVGPPKCGTTWVRSTLGAHPNAVAGGEANIGAALLPGLTATIRSFNEHQARYGQPASTHVSQSDFQLLLRQLIDRQLLRTIADGRDAFRDPLLAVIDKTPQNALQIPLLASLYPWAKFICCVRDVRDGAVSAWCHFSRQGFIEAKTIEDYARTYASQTWAPMVRAARDAGRALGSGRYAEVGFEANVEDPTRELRRLLAFIGLPDGDDAIETCLAGGDFTRATGGRPPGVEDGASFYRKGVSGDWVNHFDEQFGEELVALASG